MKNNNLIDSFVLDFQFELPVVAPIEASNLLSRLKQLSRETNIFLSTSFEASNASFFLNEVQLEGFQVKGGEEEKVGFKSFDALDDFFEAIESTRW